MTGTRSASAGHCRLGTHLNDLFGSNEDILHICTVRHRKGVISIICRTCDWRPIYENDKLLTSVQARLKAIDPPKITQQQQKCTNHLALPQ